MSGSPSRDEDQGFAAGMIRTRGLQGGWGFVGGGDQGVCVGGGVHTCFEGGWMGYVYGKEISLTPEQYTLVTNAGRVLPAVRQEAGVLQGGKGWGFVRGWELQEYGNYKSGSGGCGGWMGVVSWGGVGSVEMEFSLAAVLMCVMTVIG